MPDREPRREMPSRIQIAGCIIRNLEEEILIIHRNTPNKVGWDLPGGEIEDHTKGEKPEEAVSLDAEKELGVLIRVLGKAEFPIDGASMNCAWYNAVILSGEPKPTGEGHDSIGYYSWDELSLMRKQLSPNLKNLVDAFSTGALRFAQGDAV